MKWFIFFLMLPHLKPASLEYLWPAIAQLFDIGRLVSALIMVYLFVLKKRLPSKPVWLLAILHGWIFLSSYLNDGDIRAAFLTLASVTSIALIIDYFILSPLELLDGMLLCFEFMLYANLISVLQYYPNGMYISYGNNYRCYFLGYHNVFILYVLPAVVVALLYFSITGKKMRALFVIGAGIISVCITWSATSVCGLLAFLIILVLSKTIIRTWITYPAIFVATMSLNLLISVFRVMDRVLWMADFIESFLKKQITLTGRTYIWDSFYTLFFRSPWIGYGENVDIHTAIGVLDHTHNHWFQCLFEGGIPALAIFLMLNFLIGKQLMRHRNFVNTYIFLAAFTALYVLFIAEAYSNLMLYMLFPLAYHIDRFEAALPSAVPQPNLMNRGHHVQNRKLTEEH